MRFFFGFLIGGAVGAVVCWYVIVKGQQHPASEQRFEDAAHRAGAEASVAAHDLSNAIKAKIDTLDLHPDQIKAEMQRTGKVFRQKAQEVGNRVDDARIIGQVKAKFAGDKSLSVWTISVSCKDGHVTLSGTVPTAEDVGRAVALALEVNGVSDVTSTLEIKPK